MTIDEMQWMLELYQAKKMSKAAQNLFISQPALSQCLNRIETQLGFRLFERTSKGMVPTQKGQLFHDAAREITAIYQQFLTQAELLDTQELKEITIGMAPFLSYCCSAIVIRELRNLFPDRVFRIYEANTQKLLEAMRTGRAQIVVTSDSVITREMTSHPFGRLPCGVFLRSGSPVIGYTYERDGTRYLDPRYLADEPLCITCPGQASRSKTDRILEEAGISPKIVLESSHVSSLYRYAREGLATALCPITGEAIQADRGGTESLIYRIPEQYSNAYSHLVMTCLPDVDKRIPQGVFDCIAECILSNPDFACIQL